MNRNTEYELFTQDIYQRLLKAEGFDSTKVQHNVKLKGRSGQDHQIDVYWEYTIGGVTQKVAIECKNYNRPIPIRNVRDFSGVLNDMNNVAGIMVTRMGYQKGAKEYASHYGIKLMELRPPLAPEDYIIAQIRLTTDIHSRRTLFLIDPTWAKNNDINLDAYIKRIKSFGFNKESDPYPRHIPLQTINDHLYSKEEQIIGSIKEYEAKETEMNKDKESPDDIRFPLKDTYVMLSDGFIKINEILFSHLNEHIVQDIAIDAGNLVEAIMKDALSGESKIITHEPKSTSPK